MDVEIELHYKADLEAEDEEDARQAIEEIAELLHTFNKRKSVTFITRFFKVEANEKLCLSCYKTKATCDCKCDCCGEPVRGHPVY